MPRRRGEKRRRRSSRSTARRARKCWRGWVARRPRRSPATPSRRRWFSTRATARRPKEAALVEAVPPPPIFDPFEDNLVRAVPAFVCHTPFWSRGDGVTLERGRGDDTQDAPPAPPPPAPLRLPRPPQQAVGPKTWACLAGAVGARLAQRDEAPQALHRASKWLSRLPLWWARDTRASRRAQSPVRRLRLVLRLRYARR